MTPSTPAGAGTLLHLPQVPVRTRYSARWVLPVASPPIGDGAVLVDASGRIEAVGTAAALEHLGADRHIDLGDAALMPGLVNVHAHPELAGFRGLLEDLAFEDWILTLVRTKRRAGLSDAECATAAHWTCAESLRAGITTVGATEASAAAVDALTTAGMRGIVYREVFGPDPRDARTALRDARAAIDALRARAGSRVAVGVSPHAPYSVSDALFALVGEYALDEQLPIAVHAAESAAEEALVVHGAGPFAPGLRARGIATDVRAVSTIALLERTGVLRARPLLIHCVRLRGDDVRRIADAGAAVAHCPTANARLGHGFAPLEDLHDAGVRVGLGTDSVASNNRLDILEEARLAQMLQRGRRCSASALPPARLLEMATIDGARALGIDALTGTLEPGKAADLCAVRLGTASTLPIGDPAAAVMLAARGSDVVLTVVDGRVLYDGTCRTLDEAALAEEMRALGARLLGARPVEG
jgi:cytosine/adenosine deaminase-related metal-dependent hydrolase